MHRTGYLLWSTTNLLEKQRPQRNLVEPHSPKATSFFYDYKDIRCNKVEGEDKGKKVTRVKNDITEAVIICDMVDQIRVKCRGNKQDAMNQVINMETRNKEEDIREKKGKEVKGTCNCP